MQQFIQWGSFLLCAGVHATTSLWEVPTTSYMDMSNASLPLSGLMGISNIPGYANLRKSMSEAGLSCQKEHGDQVGNLNELQDGTKRWTLGKQEESTTCAAYYKYAEMMNEVMTDVVARMGTNMENNKKMKNGKNIAEVLKKSRQLDHFHVYTANNKTEEEETSSLTMPWHVDHGLLLAFMTPVFYASNTIDLSHGSGLLIVLGNATQVAPCLKPEVLYVMIGEQWKSVITEEQVETIPAVLHSLSMIPNKEDPAYHRTWYGKMFILKQAMDNTPSMNLPCAEGRRLEGKGGESCAYKKCQSKTEDATNAQCKKWCNSSMRKPQLNCQANCSCDAGTPDSGMDCWMLCVENFKEDECAASDQVCTILNGKVQMATECAATKEVQNTAAKPPGSDANTVLAGTWTSLLCCLMTLLSLALF